MYKITSWSEYCGDCSHQMIAHTMWPHPESWDELLKQYKWAPRCSVCQCTKWIPQNNLDRIEYLAQEKGLV